MSALTGSPRCSRASSPLAGSRSGTVQRASSGAGCSSAGAEGGGVGYAVARPQMCITNQERARAPRGRSMAAAESLAGLTPLAAVRPPPSLGWGLGALSLQRCPAAMQEVVQQQRVTHMNGELAPACRLIATEPRAQPSLVCWISTELSSAARLGGRRAGGDWWCRPWGAWLSVQPRDDFFYRNNNAEARPTIPCGASGLESWSEIQPFFHAKRTAEERGWPAGPAPAAASERGAAAAASGAVDDCDSACCIIDDRRAACVPRSGPVPAYDRPALARWKPRRRGRGGTNAASDALVVLSLCLSRMGGRGGRLGRKQENTKTALSVCWVK